MSILQVNDICIMCGQFDIPFWEFLFATLLGRPSSRSIFRFAIIRGYYMSLIFYDTLHLVTESHVLSTAMTACISGILWIERIVQC
jgi:hypothetical protein